jgi:uncharacterized repeat protein (TIGR02543 family)
MVAGVLAQESTAWESGELREDFSLTIPALPGVSYNLTMAVSPADSGSATDLINASPYAAGVQVSIQAVAASGYQFAGWAAPAGSLANAYAAATTFTMPAQNVVVTATFQVIPTTSGCFIATAAYGNPAAQQLDVLRGFRDGVLLESAAGSQFVDLYYRVSPPIADFIAGDSFLKTMVRELLVGPMVWVIGAAGDVRRD